MIYLVSFIDPKTTQTTRVRAQTVDEAIERATAKLWGRGAHLQRQVVRLDGLYGQVEYGRDGALTPRMRVDVSWGRRRA